MEKRIESRVEFDGQLLKLKVDKVSLAEGGTSRREVVEHPGAVTVLPVNQAGEIIFVSQYRYALGQEILELPAGTSEEGEDPLTTAKRELKEETGYRAKSWEKLFSFHTSPGYSNEEIHLFLARELQAGEQETEIGEEIRVLALPGEEVYRMLKSDAFQDGKTILGLLYFFLEEERG